jgi:hypothetical protein
VEPATSAWWPRTSPHTPLFTGIIGLIPNRFIEEYGIGSESAQEQKNRVAYTTTGTFAKG